MWPPDWQNCITCELLRNINSQGHPRLIKSETLEMEASRRSLSLRIPAPTPLSSHLFFSSHLWEVAFSLTALCKSLPLATSCPSKVSVGSKCWSTGTSGPLICRQRHLNEALGRLGGEQAEVLPLCSIASLSIISWAEAKDLWASDGRRAWRRTWKNPRFWPGHMKWICLGH